MKRLSIALLFFALPCVVQAQATAFIAGKPVRIVVPAAGGGNPDVLARMLAPRLQAAWGSPLYRLRRP